jgi:hypothetical protein
MIMLLPTEIMSRFSGLGIRRGSALAPSRKGAAFDNAIRRSMAIKSVEIRLMLCTSIQDSDRTSRC